VTSVTATLSDATPVAINALDVDATADEPGVWMIRLGAVVSVGLKFTDTVREIVPPPVATAVTVITLSPLSSGTVADQLVVPEAVPLPPRAFVHVTRAMPEECAAVPATATVFELT
jgi:hypothetical protein